MNIYTRTGDDGTTGLIGGQRVSKDHARIDAYGTVDELNAVLGLAVLSASEAQKLQGAGQAAFELVGLLVPVQNELFAVGARLATPPSSPYAASLPPVRGEWVQRLEGEIDAAQKRLPALSAFILPGGTELSARLHLARTVSRRAERLVVALHRVEPLDEAVLTYMNRLSDWLFVHARLANHLAGVPDVKWEKQG
jgi:cob(I)alamin adenosyltransferase